MMSIDDLADMAKEIGEAGYRLGNAFIIECALFLQEELTVCALLGISELTVDDLVNLLLYGDLCHGDKH